MRLYKIAKTFKGDNVKIIMAEVQRETKATYFLEDPNIPAFGHRSRIPKYKVGKTTFRSEMGAINGYIRERKSKIEKLKKAIQEEENLITKAKEL